MTPNIRPSAFTKPPRATSRAVAAGISLAALLFTVPLPLLATSPFQWEHAFGAKTEEICSGGFAASDGGIIIYGTTFRVERSYSDFYIVKLDGRGFNLESETIIHRELNDVVNRMAQTPDGGYILCGSAALEYGDNYHRTRGYLAKLNEQFEIVWERFYGANNSELVDMELLPDGGVVAVGTTEEKAWMIVCDDEGRASVSAVFNGIDEFTTLEPADRGGVVAMDNDGIYRRFDLEANQMWATSSWVGQSIMNYTSDMVRTSDGCYFRMSSRIGRGDTLKVSKVNANGDYVYRRATAMEDLPAGGRAVALPDGGVVTIYSSISMSRFNSNGDVTLDRWINYSDIDTVMDNLSPASIFRVGEGLAIAATAKPWHNNNREAGGSDFAFVTLNLAGDISSHHRYGIHGGTVETGCGVVTLSDGNIGAVVNSGVNEFGLFRPKLWIISPEGDSLGQIDLPHGANQFSSVGLIPYPRAPLFFHPGWILSGVYSDRWTPYQWIALLDRNFHPFWTTTISFNDDVHSQPPLDLLVARNGDVIVIYHAGGASSLKRINYRGVLCDSLVTEPGPFYGVAQPTDSTYAVLTSNCEVLLLDRALRVTGWFDAGIPNYTNTPITISSFAEGELLVLSHALNPDQRNSSYITKVSASGEILWRTRYRIDDYYVQANQFVSAGDGHFFLCNSIQVSGYDNDGRYEGGRELTTDRWRNEGKVQYFALGPDGGLYTCGSFGNDAYLGRLPYDSLGIRNGAPLRLTREQVKELPPEAPDLSVSPNPFNSMATLRYHLAAMTNVELSLYDVAGRLIKQLSSGVMNVGVQSVTLNASDLPGGVYILRLQTAVGVYHQKIVVQR